MNIERAGDERTIQTLPSIATSTHIGTGSNARFNNKFSKELVDHGCTA